MEMVAILKIITINVPDDYLDCIETLVATGLYPNRSEAIRNALKELFFNDDLINKSLRNKEAFQNKIKQTYGFKK